MVVGRKVRDRQLSIAEWRHSVRHARHAQTADQDWSSTHGLLRPGIQPHQTIAHPEPERPLAIAECRLQDPGTQAIRLREVADAASGRVDAIESVAAAHVQIAVAILGDCRETVAGQTIGGRVRDECGTRRGTVVDENQSSSFRREPQPAGPIDMHVQDGTPGQSPARIEEGDDPASVPCESGVEREPDIPRRILGD